MHRHEPQLHAPGRQARPRRTLTLLALAPLAALALTACGPEDGDAKAADAPTAAAPAKRDRLAAAKPPAPAPRADVGVITAVVPLKAREPNTGAGAVIGGLVGGALGNQVGKGDGRTAATVIGVVGGAAVGNEIEKDRRTRLDGYRLDIRLDDGRTLSVTRPPGETWTAGQRVRVIDGAVSLV